MSSFRVLSSSPRLLVFAALGVGLCASGAWAQTDASASSSTAIAQPQAASAQNDAIDQQIAAWTQGPGQPDDGSGKAAPAAARQIHGEAGVAFGSSGYRAGYITTDIPIGKDSDLGIAVGESEIKPKHFGAIRDKSLAISLNIGGSNLGPSLNCASPTMAMDGRYLEPMWESRLHGEALARDQAGCGAPDYGPEYGPIPPPRPAE